MRTSPQSQDGAGGLLLLARAGHWASPAAFRPKPTGDEDLLGWVSSSLQVWKHLVICSQEEDSSVLS